MPRAAAGQGWQNAAEAGCRERSVERRRHTVGPLKSSEGVHREDFALGNCSRFVVRNVG